MIELIEANEIREIIEDRLAESNHSNVTVKIKHAPEGYAVTVTVAGHRASRQGKTPGTSHLSHAATFNMSYAQATEDLLIRHMNERLNFSRNPK